MTTINDFRRTMTRNNLKNKIQIIIQSAFLGFGSSLSSEDCIRSCCDYVDEQFRAYFAEESGVIRKNIVDNRVHCCLYFIPGHCHRSVF